jgi:cytochrome c oxidase subunit III
MSARPTIDVSKLPTYAFGHRQLTWWATWSMILMEGTMFVVFIVSYFYLSTRSSEWPPGGMRPPGLLWGTINVLIILASCVPNYLTDKAAKKLDLKKVRLWMTVTLAFAVAFAVVRVFEFGALGVRWDQNAYGSLVWVNLGFHTAHLLTDMADTVVLIALMFLGPVEGKRFVDVTENSIYWYFVVAMWLPLYCVIYIAPRLMT